MPTGVFFLQREAVMELDIPQKWAIYIALAVDGEKYFNELKKLFGANPNTIDKNLKSLVASGLVVKKVKQPGDIGNSNKTYYASTRFGEKLLAGLYEVILPPPATHPAAAPATRSRSRATRIEES
jgi:DNA-binding HxlR family transcriptional regulator